MQHCTIRGQSADQPDPERTTSPDIASSTSVSLDMIPDDVLREIILPVITSELHRLGVSELSAEPESGRLADVHASDPVQIHLDASVASPHCTLDMRPHSQVEAASDVTAGPDAHAPAPLSGDFGSEPEDDHASREGSTMAIDDRFSHHTIDMSPAVLLEPDNASSANVAHQDHSRISPERNSRHPAHQQATMGASQPIGHHSAVGDGPVEGVDRAHLPDEGSVSNV
jgi:hypothetical protein